jgi:1-deoxy-D-xylulose-5-phosphate reductoisomerase
MLHKKISVAILGSTGSIGRTSLKVISQNSKYFKVDLLACKNNKANIDKQIKKFLPKFVIITNDKNYNFFKKKKFKKKIKFFNNLD